MLQTGCSICFSQKTAKSLTVAATYLSEEHLNNEEAGRKEADPTKEMTSNSISKSGVPEAWSLYLFYSYKKS